MAENFFILDPSTPRILEPCSFPCYNARKHLNPKPLISTVNTRHRKKGFTMTSEQVKIFSLSTCSHCKATKKLLDECTIQYDFVDVDLTKGDERKAILEDVKKFNPKCSFPTIIIGEKVIVGYKEDEIKEALGL
jgi:glutaredoxin